MKNTISFILNFKNNVATSVSAFITGKSYNLNSGHTNFKQVCAELDKVPQNVERVKSLFDVATAVVEYSGGTVSVKNGIVTYNGESVHNVVTDRILAFMRQGLPYKPLLKFLENLMLNPSNRARTELYSFLEKLNDTSGGGPQITLTNQGTFLCFKGVDSNFYSKHAGNLKLISGTADAQGHIYNGIGEVIETDRGNVCDDARVACAPNSLHTGDWSYALSWAGAGGKVVLVEVNPKDVCSICFEDVRKCRVSKYIVREEVKDERATNTPYVEFQDALTKRDALGRFC